MHIYVCMRVYVCRRAVRLSIREKHCKLNRQSKARPGETGMDRAEAEWTSGRTAVSTGRRSMSRGDGAGQGRAGLSIFNIFFKKQTNNYR